VRRLPSLRGRADFAPLCALGGLLAAGLGLRVWLLVVWRPAVLGFPDEAAYLHVAATTSGPVADPLHPVGYPVFLMALHALGASLAETILIQHLLGLVTAVLLFAIARRAGANAWLALLPALVILLCGDEIFIEHTVLSEPLFIFLSGAALYCALRADAGPRAWAWAASAGLLLGVASTVRDIGLALIPVVVVWLAARRPGVRGRRAWLLALTPAATTAIVAVAIALSYAGWHAASAGGLTFSTNSAYILYGRVAPWANCKDFNPPPGTSFLCQTIPYDRRPGAGVYIFRASPATKLFGPPSNPLSRQASAKLRAFAEAAIVHQPFTYLWTVIEKFLRVIYPGNGTPGEGQTPSTFLPYIADLGRSGTTMGIVRSMYGADTPAVLDPSAKALISYDSRTHAVGVVMALLIIFAAVATWLMPRDGPRRRTVLLALFAFALLVTPLFSVDYDYRYVIPALGPLSAAAAVGASGLWRRCREGESTGAASMTSPTAPALRAN
jgi:4-amino-4-deoxy-L-arabinose transferase-like glycosyltransferase